MKVDFMGKVLQTWMLFVFIILVLDVKIGKEILEECLVYNRYLIYIFNI